jgi:hypothetical protein
MGSEVKAVAGGISEATGCSHHGREEARGGENWADFTTGYTIGVTLRAIILLSPPSTKQ